MSNTDRGGWHPGYIKRIDAKGRIWLIFLTEKYEEWVVDPEFEMVPGRGPASLGEAAQTIAEITASQYLELKKSIKGAIVKSVTIDPPWTHPDVAEEPNSG